MACTSYCSNTKIPSLFIAEYIVSLSMSATAKIKNKKNKKLNFLGVKNALRTAFQVGNISLDQLPELPSLLLSGL